VVYFLPLFQLAHSQPKAAAQPAARCGCAMESAMCRDFGGSVANFQLGSSIIQADVQLVEF